MTRPRLLVTRKLPDDVEARACREFDARLNPSDRIFTGEELVAAARDMDSILCAPGDRMDATVIDRLPGSVRAIATFSVGHDHIDVGAAAVRGITVCNTPDVLSTATAEVAILLMLAAARRAGEGEREIRGGRWTGWAPTHLMGSGVTGKRLGIFGMGRIGREVAQMARGFRMEIHYHNRSRVPSEDANGAIFHEGEESFLQSCDILALNAPATPQTENWLSAERISLLRRGAIVVNTARGSLIDDAALIAALSSGHVAAAGLDVYRGEPNIDPNYLDLENVVLLPHIGSATRQVRNAMGFLALDGIGSVLHGDGRPANRVVV